MDAQAEQQLVFLDQQHWVALLRRAPGSQAGRVRHSLEQAVREGRVVVPLTAGHYLETWHRARWRSRHALAEVMRDLSGWRTLAPPQRVLRLELERVLGGGVPVLPAEVLGHGVDHAFDSTTGRFRLVSRAWTSDLPVEGQPLVGLDAQLHDVRDMYPENWEWFNLAGPAEDFPLTMFDDTQIELRPEHRRGDEFVSAEREIIGWLAQRGMTNRVREALVTDDLLSMVDDINQCCLRLRHDPDQLRTPGALPTLHRALPSRDVLADLRSLRLENPQFPLEQHDRVDLLGLAVALVYCDVVVTERRWRHFASRLGIRDRFRTIVVSHLDELPALLV